MTTPMTDPDFTRFILIVLPAFALLIAALGVLVFRRRKD